MWSSLFLILEVTIATRQPIKSILNKILAVSAYNSETTRVTLFCGAEFKLARYDTTFCKAFNNSVGEMAVDSLYRMSLNLDYLMLGITEAEINRVGLTSCFVTLAKCHTINVDTTTPLPMIGHLCDVYIVVSLDKE